MATSRSTGDLVTASVWNALFTSINDAGTIWAGAVAGTTIAGTTGNFSSTLTVTGAGAFNNVLNVFGGGAGNPEVQIDGGSTGTPALRLEQAGTGRGGIYYNHTNSSVDLFYSTTSTIQLASTTRVVMPGVTLQVGAPIHELRTISTNSTDSNQTYTAAQLLGGIMVRSGISALRTDKVDTAANIVAAIPGAFVGLSFRCLVVNSDDASELQVVGASAGITYVGTDNLWAAGDMKELLMVITDVGTPAVTVYVISSA